MGKYRFTNRKEQPYPDAQIMALEAIANELAEMNRLKRIELRYFKVKQGAPPELKINLDDAC